MRKETKLMREEYQETRKDLQKVYALLSVFDLRLQSADRRMDHLQDSLNTISDNLIQLKVDFGDFRREQFSSLEPRLNRVEDAIFPVSPH